MIHTFSITIPQLTDNLERKGYIYLPDTYNNDIDKHYPVMYMFDGHNVFFDEDATYGTSWGMADYLQHNPADIIIIALECNHNGHSRLSEYTPFDFSYEPIGNIHSSGKIYMDWLTGTFKPMVDKKLRTQKDRKNTFICGSSMGGLMSLYGVTAYNKFFNHAICLSPSLWIAPEKLYDMINKSKMNQETCIYLDYGSKELNNHAGVKDVLLETTKLLLHKNTNATLRIIQGGTHSEASWSKQVPIFMKLLGF
ncbi:MAG: alpha/beta hydrolase [Lachnospiraceae bacterium]|nr:alpha/beta hydrolase [Lachnospiraceae bacterium]